MNVKFHRASRQFVSTAFAILALLGLASTPRASAQSRITVSVSPATASVQAGGGSRQFTATVRNDRHNRGVRWTLSGGGCSGSSCGTLSATTSTSGTPIAYTAPPSAPSPATVTLTATSVSNTARSASAIITVTNSSAALGVTISPKRGALSLTQMLPVTATVQNDVSAAGVTWSASGPACSGTSCGTFANVTSNSATYIAPSTPGMYSVTATSVADVTKNASNSIAVTDLSGVLTYHNNLSRDGTNTHEFALTTLNVNTFTFGKLFSCQADGAIYAQPLWVPNLTVAGASHNVIIVATQHESLYAFDADAAPCVTLWHVSLVDAAHGGTSGETSVPSAGAGALVGSGYGDISPEVGITGTPVIDPATKTLYVVSKSVNASTQFFQRLHAIDLATGNERVAPQSIDSSISVPGTGAGSVAARVAFDPRNEAQRPGLVLSNGVVYVAWASHEDHDPYHGWVIGFTAATLAPVANAVFNSTPNQVGTLSYSRGGIWMGGGAPAVDSSENLFFITGNGTFDANTGGSNYGDSVVKLSTASGLSVADYFTPLDQASLDANDTDFGSGAATILVDQPAGPVTHLVIGGGKQGNLFLLNRDNMGKFNSSSNNVIQTINLGNSIFATPVFWQNNLYVAGVGPLKQFVFSAATGKFNGAPLSQSSTNYRFPGATPSISSNGTVNGIVWALDNGLYCTPQSPGCGATVLHAYDATNLATELWNSSQAAGNRDLAGHAVKFTVPTIANGKVYVGTRGNDSTVLGELEVYGLLPN
ncbi:MAG TPA: pyrrolo-quinoline quinone [Candidatus Angelobacter sp.]|nr:pyrrolo-quinoline quinone [Candidatus Angelobacter sp.]